jgi:DNA replication protein DnaC
MNAQLEGKMKQLRLSGMVQAVPARIAQAQGGHLTHLEFLELLVTDELAVRADRLCQRRLKQAGITEVKDFTDFNWNFNPKLPRMRLCELATARFVREKTNVLLVGPPGVGKSHSVTAVTLGVIRAGYRVMVKSLFMLANELLDAEANGGRRELVQQLSEVDLLILEDFGMKTLRASAAEDLLDIIMRRHERRSTIITTNRPTEDWAAFLGDVPAATAILDRFLQHVEILIMEGRSYRLDPRGLGQGGQADTGPVTEITTPDVSTEPTPEPPRSSVTRDSVPPTPGSPRRARRTRSEAATPVSESKP